jgi:hypothetical protein
MKKCLFLATFWLVAQFPASAQVNEITQLGEKLLRAFQYSDTAAFMNCFTRAQEINRLTYQHYKIRQMDAPDSNTQVVSPDLEKLLRMEFWLTRKKYADSGVNWKSVRVKDCYYQVMRDKSSLYPSARAELVFESMGKTYALQLLDMIYMNDQWKLITFQPASFKKTTISRVSYFIEQEGLFSNEPTEVKKEKEPVKPAKPVAPKKTVPKPLPKPAGKKS